MPRQNSHYHREISAGRRFCRQAGKKKTRYLTKGAADAGIAIHKRRNPETERYSYGCLPCRGYHTATYLTEQEEMELRQAM